MYPGLENLKKQPPEALNKKGALNFTKLTGKQLCPSFFFNNIAGLRPATLLKKTPTKVFSCQFYEFLKTLCLQNTSGRLLLMNRLDGQKN